jgi:hypothetical protein
VNCHLIHFTGVWQGAYIVAAHTPESAWECLREEFQRIEMVSCDLLEDVSYNGPETWPCIIYGKATSTREAP